MTDDTPGDSIAPRSAAARMRALCFNAYGEPYDVLHLEDVEVPRPGAGRIRIRVHGCALNPADWALCKGFAATTLPRGIGLDVSGTVDAVGDGATGVSVGDLVFGVPDFRGYPSAGAAEFAVLLVWERVPDGLGLVEAAALPMAVETAVRSLDLLGVPDGETLLVSGGGTMTGFAAVQIARSRGLRVIATSGETFASRLRELGAEVTPYGGGLADRVRAIAGDAPVMVLHTAQTPATIPDLIAIAAGEPHRVMSISSFDEAGLGVRTTGREPNVEQRYDALGPYARLAAEGRFTIPIARTFPLADWRSAAELSIGGRPHGKIVLLA